MPAKPAQTPKTHIVILEDDRGRREFLLNKSKYSLGRAEECDIIIRSPFVSRHHATLIRECDDNGYLYYQIFDGDGQNKLSANGILINGCKVNGYQLKDGDKVVFSLQVFAIYRDRPSEQSDASSWDFNGDEPFDITLIDPGKMMGDLGD